LVCGPTAPAAFKLAALKIAWREPIGERRLSCLLLSCQKLPVAAGGQFRSSPGAKTRRRPGT
jgi:hypothetical protein